MKNWEKWTPSKYVYRGSALRASRDTAEVGLSSRVISDAVAAKYGTHISSHCSGRLIDLGCGAVPLYVAYSHYVDEVICVDWPQSSHQKSFLDYECDLSEPLPLGDEEFETAIMSDVLEHLPRPDCALHEAHRILKPGGKLLLNVPFYYWLHEEPFDYYRYTEHALRFHLENAGFRIVVLEPLGGVPEILADVISKSLGNFPLVWRSRTATRALATMVQSFCGRFVSMRVGRRFSEQTARKFPLGYFTVCVK